MMGKRLALAPLLCGLGLVGCSATAPTSTVENPAALPTGSDWRPDGDVIVVFAADPKGVVGFDASALEEDAWGDQVFVRNMTSGAVELVSVSVTGGTSRGRSQTPVATPDGRFVAFVSDAHDLTVGDTNDDPDVFVRDRATGETRRASVPSDWREFTDGAFNPSISDNGRYIAFEGVESNAYGVYDRTSFVFRHDQASGTSIVVGEAADGTWPNGQTYWPAMSADGSTIAFLSMATNLDGGDGSACQAFVWKDDGSVRSRGLCQPGVEMMPSLSADGQTLAFALAQPDGAGSSNATAGGLCAIRPAGAIACAVGPGSAHPDDTSGKNPVLSRDGRYLYFGARSRLDPADNDDAGDLYRMDIATKTISLVDVNVGSNAEMFSWTGGGTAPFSLSPNGRYVVVAAMLEADGAPGGWGAWVYDLESGTTERVG